MSNAKTNSSKSSKSYTKNNNFKGRNSRSKGSSNSISRSSNTNKNSNDVDMKAPNGNDASWYMRNGQLTKDVANFVYGNRLGDSLNIKLVEGIKDPMHVPGILTLDWMPTVAGLNANNSASPLNMAASQLYAYVVHANSRNTKYDPCDLMMCVIAASSVFSAIGAGIRAYGIAKASVQQNNTYLPNALLTSLGFNGDDILRHLTEFRSCINVLISKASVLWVPANYDILKRWFFLNSHVYTDDSSPKAQLYAFKQLGYYFYDEKSYETGTALKYKTVPDFNVDSYYDYVDEMIECILNATDMGMMMADVMNAYGKEKLFWLGSLDEEYEVFPAYNLEVLHQIHNATTILPNESGTAYDIVQTDKGVMQINAANHITLRANTSAMEIAILDMLTSTVTPELNMVATRFTALARKVSVTGGSYIEYITGTELITNFHLISRPDVYGGNWFFTSNDVYQEDSITSSEAKNIGLLSLFSYAPFKYLIVNKGSAIGNCLIGYVGDFHNFTEVDTNELAKIHKTAMMSEFDIPMV